jgi:phosphoribosylaminoimidazole (AIR) synthetase
MGVGMIAIIPKAAAQAALTALDGEGWLIGEVVAGQEIEWA